FGRLLVVLAGPFLSAGGVEIGGLVPACAARIRDLDGGEKCLHAVKIARGNTVVLVIVTLRAPDGQAKKYRPDGGSYFAQQGVAVLIAYRRPVEWCQAEETERDLFLGLGWRGGDGRRDLE